MGLTAGCGKSGGSSSSSAASSTGGCDCGPCATGQQACDALGNVVCVGTNLQDGTACGANLACYSGQCASASCGTPGQPCGDGSQCDFGSCDTFGECP